MCLLQCLYYNDSYHTEQVSPASVPFRPSVSQLVLSGIPSNIDLASIPLQNTTLFVAQVTDDVKSDPLLSI